MSNQDITAIKLAFASNHLFLMMLTFLEDSAEVVTLRY